MPEGLYGGRGLYLQNISLDLPNLRQSQHSLQATVCLIVLSQVSLKLEGKDMVKVVSSLQYVIAWLTEKKTEVRFACIFLIFIFFKVN